MGQSNANISRNMYDEAKSYQLLVHQQGVPWVEADENDRNWIFYNLLRRFLQKIVGSGALNDGFKIVGTGAANDFTITGGDGTPEGAGRLLVEGFQCILPEDRNYKSSGNLECTPVSTNLSETVLTDSAANFTLGGADNNLAGRILAPDITQPGLTYSITANTQTTITVSGTMLADGITAGVHYRLELSTPSGADRTDEVYIDCYLDEIDGEEDPEIKHTLGMEIETQRRLKLIQNVLVAEGGTTPASYTDSDGNKHYTLKLAAIQRYDGQVAINPGDVIDARVSIDTTMLDIAAEVMAARGNKNSLDERLDVFLDEDGTPKPFPSGTKMVFFQAAAPPGWTQDTTHNDKALRVVSGSGGGSGGTLDFSSLTVGGHTLTISEIPAHTHFVAGEVRADYEPPDDLRVPGSQTTDSGSTGGGGSHNHPLGLKYVDVIVCAKN